MGLQHSPSIVTSGLVLNLDAANLKSKSYNVISSPENLSSLLTLRAGASVTSDATTAPDGTQTADLITGTGSGFGYYYPAWPTGNATHSFFVKPAGATTTFTFSHVGTGWGGTFTFSTGAFSSLAGYTGSYTALSNGWYLVIFSSTSETANYYAELSFNNNNGGYIWGVQLTPFSTYKTYIPLSTNLAATASITSFIDTVGTVTGTLTNGPAFSGTGNGGITFDGVDDYIETNTTNIISGTNPFSFDCFYYTNGSFNAEIFGNYGSGYTSNTIWISGRYGVWINGSSPYFVGSPLGAGTYHMAYTRDGSGNCVLYLNGVQNGTAVNTTSISSSQNFRIGSDVNGYGEQLAGNIYALKVYNVALTAAQVQQNFNALRGRYGI